MEYFIVVIKVLGLSVVIAAVTAAIVYSVWYTGVYLVNLIIRILIKGGVL